MKVACQLQAAIAAGEPLQWQKLRDQLVAEHADATAAGEHESLLVLFKTLMDMVERIDITPGLEAAFKADRQQCYDLMVIHEASPGGRCSVQALDAITRREVQAGRMLEDDPLREAAIFGFVARCKMPIATPVPTGELSGDSGMRVAWLGRGWLGIRDWFVRRSRRPMGA